MKKTEPRLVRQIVFEAVRNRLTAAAVGLDEPLQIREEALAADLGVSRTPIREALVRLSQIGLVELQPRKGATLVPATRDEYLQWLDIRAELEAFAAGEAAQTASQRDVHHLRALFKDFRREEEVNADPEGYAAANLAFHRQLIVLSENGLLLRIWELFDHQMVRADAMCAPAHVRDSLDDHQLILDAIEQRDSVLAALRSRKHVQSHRRLFEAGNTRDVGARAAGMSS